jgi:hypothetical protein
LEHNGEESTVVTPAEADALGGVWQEMDLFRVRLLQAAPAGRRAWVLVEVHAKAADDDFRIITAQKLYAPFASGLVEVVEPGLGRSLRYECGALK